MAVASRRSNSLVLLVVLLIVCEQSLDHVAAEFCGLPTQLLPNWYILRHYDIDLEIDPIVNKFGGKIELTLDRSENKNTVVLHAGPNLSIKKVEVFDQTGSVNQFETSDDRLRQVGIREICHDEHYELLVIDLDPKGTDLGEVTSILVSIEYEGFTPADHKGLVRMNYYGHDRNGLGYHVIYSKFGRFGAHYLVPCFNESRLTPTIKLSFNKVPADHIVVSFSSISKVFEVKPNEFRYEFDRTQEMAISGLAFIMGNCFEQPDFVESSYAIEQKRLLTFNTVGSPKLSQYVQDMLTLSFYNIQAFLNSTYARKTLKIFLVPGISRELEVNAAAVIIVNPDRLDHDPDATEDKKETSYFVASLVEMMARQWFGYIVRLTRDDETWLFEGLVGWVALRLTDEIDPSSVSYRILFQRNQLDRAMIEDSRATAQSIESSYARLDLEATEESLNWNLKNHYLQPAIFTSSSIRGDFNLSEMQRIKSIAIIMMNEESCEGEFLTFLTGLLQLYRWKGIQYREFTQRVRSKCEWHNSFTLNKFKNDPHFPLVKATFESPKYLRLTQVKFRADYRDMQNEISEFKNTWSMTLTCTIGTSADVEEPMRPLHWLKGVNYTKPRIELAMDPKLPLTWVKLNNFGNGYFRVMYSDLLLKNLKSGARKLNEMDCLNLLLDALAIVRSGLRGSYYVVDVMKLVSTKSHEILQDALVEAFKELRTIHGPSVNFKQLRSFGLQLFSKPFLTKGFSVSDLHTKQGRQARGKAYEVLARSDFAPILLEAKRLYHSGELAKLHKDLHVALVISIARYGSDEDVLELLAPHKLPEERNEELDAKIFSGLAQAKSLERLNVVWDHAKRYGNPRLIVDFVKNLYEMREGLQFVNTNVIRELASLYPTIGRENYVKLIKSVCFSVINTWICTKSSDFIKVLDDEAEIAEILNEAQEERQRKFFSLQLDINKFVIE